MIIPFALLVFTMSLIIDVTTYAFVGEFGNSFRSKLIINVINGHPTKDRDFAVVLRRTEDDELICGATLIDVYWAVTAAHCVLNFPEAMFYLEYTKWKTSRRRNRVILRKFIHPGFQINAGYRNDIALLRLKTKISDAQLVDIPGLILPVCKDHIDLFQLGRQMLGFTGFGSTSRSNKLYRMWPRETFFYESMFASHSTTEGIEFCREDNVCVDPISINSMASQICDRDGGSPLYTINSCDPNLTAQCLYGVASYYRNVTDPLTNKSLKCYGGSFFANIVYFRDWIERTMNGPLRYSFDQPVQRFQ